MTTILLYTFTFWIIFQIFNLLGLAVAFRLFKNLPDRGYAFARPVGLLLTGFVLWFGGTFGLLKNNLGGTLLAMAAVGGLGMWWQLQKNGDSLRTRLKLHLRYVLTVEILFALALVGWAIFKSYNPAIETAGGEKWMETAFVNSTLLSPTFPPRDPWLAGYGISYYYFGYVLMVIPARLSGIVPTTAFNLFIPTLFALTLTGAFGITANLIAVYERRRHPDMTVANGAIRSAGLLGALFVGVMGHWEGLLEVLHTRGLLSPRFWQWLDILDLREPPVPGDWLPSRFLWWWRGSRVVLDYSLTGQTQEMIDEFPFFSFMLGDVHPHVLALPFVLLAIALTLNLLLAKRPDPLPDSLAAGFSALVDAVGGRLAFALTAIAIGALGFLNTWDLPIYLTLFGLAFVLWLGRARLTEAVIGVGVFAVLAGIIYLPFYLSFQSQAGGILPNLWNPTRLRQFVVFFGPFLLMVTVLLLMVSHTAKWRWQQELGGSLTVTVLGPLVLLAVLVVSFLVLPGGRAFVQTVLNDPNVQTALNGASVNDLLQEIIRRRLTAPWTFLLLGGLTGWALAHLWAGTPKKPVGETVDFPAEKFALVLTMVGLALPLAVEFVYLKDLFGYRMNTVFKFYFQAWILLALVSAFAVYYVSQELRGIWRGLWQGSVAVAIAAAMVYPVLAIPTKAQNFRPQPTLDGIAWVQNQHPDDYAAILWLRENAPSDAVVLERPGKSYSYLSRVSALTGRQTLVGWDFHEYQWRGTLDVVNARLPDIETIYNGLDPTTTLTLLDKYDITYIYVGPSEREAYAPNGLAKFNRLLKTVYQQGAVTIYER